MSSIDLELAPLVNEQVVTSEEQPKSFSKTARTVAAIGSLLSLAAVAALSYSSPSSAAMATTNLESHGSDLAICKGTYIQGVTVRSAEDGCAIVSNGDMYGWNGDAMPTITYCVGSGDKDGKVGFTYGEIKSHGELDMDSDGISGISPGRYTNVIVYSGRNFDGESVTIYNAEDDGRLWRKKYPSGKTVNDNVGSFEIVTDLPSGTFAGKNCGQSTSVCMGVHKKGAALYAPDNGCISFASVDPTAKSEGARIKMATVCATNAADKVSINYDSLMALNMIQKGGEKLNQISYIGRGEQVTYVESFEGKNFGAGSSNLQTGSMVGQKYPSGNLISDNVNSVHFQSFAPTLAGCGNKDIIM